MSRGRSSAPRLRIVLGVAAILLLLTLVVGAVLLGAAVPARSVSATSAQPALDATPLAATSIPASPESAGPMVGGLTDGRLRSQVWSTIVSFQRNVRACTDLQGGKIEVTQEPDTSGSWEEAWNIVACGQSMNLKIRFTAHPEGGFYYDIAE